MAAMTDKIAHDQPQIIPVIPAGRMLKSIASPSFVDGDIVELPSHELVRWQSAPPAPTDRAWHLHPQTEDGGSDPEHASWKHADRSPTAIYDFWEPDEPIWIAGLVAPRGEPVACLLDVDHCDGNHTYLCSHCYSHGPEGGGYDPGEGYAVITALDRGYCEICCAEYATQDDRLIELPEGTLERDELAAKNASLEAQIRERALPAPLGCLCAHHARGGDPYEGCDAAESSDAEDDDGHDLAFDRLLLARLVVALGLPRDMEGVAKLMACDPETLGEYYAFAAQVVREADAKAKAVGPRCPKCEGTDRLCITETYTAMHPLSVLPDGTMTVGNALSSDSPSHHFDDGSENYGARCRSCGYEGSLAEFRITSWEWV